MVQELCKVHQEFSLAEFRSRFLHYFKDASLEAQTRHRISDKAYEVGLLGLRKIGDLKFMGDEDPPKWGDSAD